MNYLDQFINYVAPQWGAQRTAARQKQRLLGMQARRYEAAMKGGRTSQWRAPVTSSSSEIDRALVDLRNRSRDLVRNNAYANRAVSKIANNTVGIGIVPKPILSSKPQEKKITALWKAWADRTCCDWDGHNTMSGIQHLAMRTVAESGECIIRKRIINDKSLPLPLQLQVLEGDFIATIKHAPAPDQNGTYVMYGVEFNNLNKITAYWLYDQHPGDAYRLNLSYTRHPVDEVIHLFVKERPGQFRGVPMGYSAMLRLKDLDEYMDAQLIRQKIASCFAAFVVNKNGEADDSDGDLPGRLEPGTIQTLEPGEEIQFATPPAADGYADYTKSVIQEVAAGYGMDSITLSGDYSQVNFSSGRMGWLEFHRSIAHWQWNMLVPMMLDKAWMWFEQMAGIFGVIRPGQNILAEWSTPRREMIDPEKEIKAQAEAVQSGLLPWQDAIRANGDDPDVQLEKMKADKKAFTDAGLPNYTSKPDMNGKSAAPTSDPPGDAESGASKDQ